MSDTELDTVEGLFRSLQSKIETKQLLKNAKHKKDQGNIETIIKEAGAGEVFFNPLLQWVGVDPVEATIASGVMGIGVFHLLTKYYHERDKMTALECFELAGGIVREIEKVREKRTANRRLPPPAN